MENRINIAELLRECPKGMALYSPIFGEVYLDKIRPHLAIVVTTDKEQGYSKEEFLYDGRYGMNGECMLFPSKGKTTWEGFVPPCKFKDGDILAYTSSYTTVFIYRDKDNKQKYATSFYVGYTIGCSYCNFHIYNKSTLIALNGDCDVRLATEEEKQKLFKAIKEYGYKWNAETKTLEKLPKFKVGDRVKHKCENFRSERTIVSYGKSGYWTSVNDWIDYENQDDWELVPNKFDITTLQPFDKVLVRGNVGQKWTHDFFGFMDKDKGCPFVCVGHYVIQCIPYEGNERLLGKTDDCTDFYKTWE